MAKAARIVKATTPTKPPLDPLEVVSHMGWGFEGLAAHVSDLALIFEEITRYERILEHPGALRKLRVAYFGDVLRSLLKWPLQPNDQASDPQVEYVRGSGVRIHEAFGESVDSMLRIADEAMGLPRFSDQPGWILGIVSELSLASRDVSAVGLALDERLVDFDELVVYLRRRSASLCERAAECWGLSTILTRGIADGLRPQAQTLMNLLRGRYMNQKELAKAMGTTPGVIGNVVDSIRDLLGKQAIRTRRGRGYWLPTAPPPEERTSPARR